MSERLSKNQRTAASLALLIGAGLLPIAATLYAAENRAEIDYPNPSSSPDPLPSALLTETPQP